MTKHATDFACGSGAVRTRTPLDSVCRSKTLTDGPSGRRSCSQPPLEGVADRDAPPRGIVVPDEHALRLGDDAAVGTDHVLELEALRSDPGAARRHLHLVAGAQLGAK